jgi:O-antigen/teichoic acid export membrane protein
MPGLTKYFLDPLYRNSLFLMLNTGLVSFFNYVFWLIASRIAPAAHIGVATEAISAAAMIVALSRLGMDDSLTRFFPQSKDPVGFYNALIAIILLVTIIAIAGFFLGLPYISPALLFLNKWQYSLLFIGYVILTSVCDMQGTALVAIRRADLAFLQYGILILRIPLLFAMGSLGAIGIFLALDIAYLATMAAGVVLLYKTGISRDLHINIGEARKTVVFSIGSYTSTTIATAAITLIPILIVNVAGAAEEAYFYIAYTIATFLFMVPDSIGASMFVEGSHERPLRATAFKALKFNLILLAPMVLVIVLFGDKILLLISPEYSAAAHQLLLLLAISSLFYAVTSVYITVVQVQKNMVMLNYIKLAVSGLALCLGFILLLKVGLIGIGYAWLLSNMIVSVIAGWMMVSKKNW